MRAPPWLIRWHRYCALAVLLFVLLASVSGVLLLYKKPLLRTLVAEGAQLPLNYTQQQVQRELAQLAPEPGISQRLKAPNAEEPYWTRTLPDGSRQLLQIETLQPYTDCLWLVTAMEWVRQFHYTLLAGAAGEVVMLGVGLSLLFLLFGGIWLWWPARRGFRWRWVAPFPPVGRRWLLYHRHSGIVLVPTMVLSVATGTIMLQQKVWNLVSAAPPETEEPVRSMPVNTGQTLSQLLQRGQQEFPGGWPTYLRTDGTQARFRFRQPGEWHANGRNWVQVGTEQGEGLEVSRTEEASGTRRLLDQMYPLHSAYGLPGWYRLSMLVSGIGAIWLSVVGGLSWWQRRHR